MTAAALPVLYSFRRCPYAMRARLALLASATVCELREVVLARKPAELLQASPKGTVPVLVLPDCQVLDESLDIMQWALRRHDPLKWLPDESRKMEAALALIAQCDADFKAHLDRYKYPNRYALADGLTDRDLGKPFLQALNDRLKATTFLHGEHFGLTDAAIAPFVRQYAHTDPVWFTRQPWSALQAWLADFETSAVYHAAMEKHLAWTQEQTPVRFPASP